MYSKILTIKNSFESINKKQNEKKKHILVSKSFYKIENLNQTFKHFLLYLWDNPKIIYKLIISTDLNLLKDSFFPLLINHFHENFFSLDFIGNKLLYIIILLINKEINQIDSLNSKDNFLESEIFNLFINELIKKVEIQNYFKLIIIDVINDINNKSNEREVDCNDYISDNKINLDVLYIEKIINKIISEKENINNKKAKTKKSAEKISLKENEKIEKDNGDYSHVKKYFDDITKNILENKYSNNETPQNIKEFCLYQIKVMDYLNKNNNNNMEIFSNQNILKNIYKSSISSKILKVYQKFFSMIIDELNLLLKNIQENLTVLPSSLKIICKVIVLLAKKRFGNNLSYIDSVFFFGKFFFDKILLNFIQYPQLNYLLNNTLYFSEETIYNLEIISIIFSKFYSGNLFFQTEDGGNLTPFNGYFLDKMSDFYKIFDDIISINIPTHIQNLINSENLEDFEYKYNYFDENESEAIQHESCCISLNDLFLILTTFNNNKSLFLDKDEQLKSYYDQLKDKTLYKNIKNIEYPNFFINDVKEKPIAEKKEIIHLNKNFTNVNNILNPNIEYLIFNRISFNKKIFKKINDEFSFEYLIDDNKTNEENVDNNKSFLKKIKYSLFQVLCNTPYLDYMINKNYINPTSLNDILLFFSDIKKYQNYMTNLKTSNNDKNFFPNEFSINFLIDHINNISSNYSENNYELLINEVKEDINHSIKTIEFDKLGQFYNNSNYCQIKKEIYQQFLKSLIKLNIYKKVKKIIEQAPVFVKIKVTHGNNMNNFDNLSINIKQSISNAKKMKTSDNIYIDSKKNIIVFKTIESFAKNFRFDKDINFLLLEYLKYHASENKDIFDYISKVKFNEKLLEFFNKEIRFILSEHNYFESFDKSLINKIMTKIYIYFLNYLYDSIYKYLPSQTEIDLYTKMRKLAWTKLSNFVRVNGDIYECAIERIINIFNSLEKSKIPSEKFFLYKDIEEICENIPCKEKIKFFNKTLNKEIFLKPIILYGIIKAKPKYIISDVKYVQYFIQEKNKDVEKYFDILLPSYILYIKELDHNHLYNINEDQYIVQCNQYDFTN